MSLRNYIKKLGKRAAGTWGRVNHKRDMRAVSKGVRQEFRAEITFGILATEEEMDVIEENVNKPEFLNKFGDVLNTLKLNGESNEDSNT